MPIDISFESDTDLSNFASKTYNDQNYINVEGDTLQGDLDLNNHKITNVSTPTADKDCVPKDYVDSLIRRNSENDIILETSGNFIIKTPQSESADSNIIKFYVNDDKIHCNSKRVTDLLPPVNNNDACTKIYVDSQIAQAKTIFSTCVQGEMLTIRFDLRRMEASTVHRLGDPTEQSFFVLSHRFRTLNNLWDAQDNPKVKISVKDNFLHIERKGLFPTRELTGVGEVLLFKGSAPVDIMNMESTSHRPVDRVADIDIASP